MTDLSRVPDEELLRLDHQICFSLHAASRAFGGVYRTVLKDLDLTYPQYLVMLVLWEHGELPVKRIGEHLRLDSGTLSPCSSGSKQPATSGAPAAAWTSAPSPSGSPRPVRRCASGPSASRAGSSRPHDLTPAEAATLQSLLARVTGSLDHAAQEFAAAPPGPGRAAD